MASTAARAMWARVVAADIPVSAARASRSQCGAPNPAKAGTSTTPSADGTPAANSISAPTSGRPSIPAVQASAAPDDTMLPSKAYTGRSVNHASVHPVSTNPSTGVITDEPVPYVALTIPAHVQPCPYIAACESASTAAIGIPSASPGTPFVTPKPAFDGRTSGNADRGTPKASSSSADQFSATVS